MKERYTYLDILRVLSSIAVITIHTIGKWYYGSGYLSKTWIWVVIFDGNSRWAVPMFVMISGALLLKHESEVVHIRARVLKYGSLFLFWSFVYAVFYYLTAKQELLVTFLTGSHLYFFYIIIGIYIILPVLNSIFQYDKLTRYFLALWIIFTFVIPAVQFYFFYMVHGTRWEKVAEALTFSINISNIHLPVGYSGFFVLGGVLNRKSFSIKTGLLIYILGSTITVLGVCAFDTMTGFTERLFDYFSINVCLMCIGIFIIMKWIGKNISSDATKQILAEASTCSTGIYIIHMMVLKLTDFKETFVFFFPLLSIPVAVIINWLLCFTVVWTIRKIPLLNKFF